MTSRSRLRRCAGYPFTLGVASGEPLPRGVTLWTRLAPEPFAKDGGIAAKSVQVQWQVATDEGFTNIVASGTVAALAELAHSVHVDVNGLQPGRDYFYRFIVAARASPVGRTKTAPARARRRAALRVRSCQDWQHGFYSAYRRMAEQDLDLVIHLGDYIYEDGICPTGGARNVKIPATLREEYRSLERYRLQHALYKTDPDLQAAHRIFPWAVTWDDHEVENDYAGTHPEDSTTASGFSTAAPPPTRRTTSTCR